MHGGTIDLCPTSPDGKGEADCRRAMGEAFHPLDATNLEVSGWARAHCLPVHSDCAPLLKPRKGQESSRPTAVCCGLSIHPHLPVRFARQPWL